MLIAITLVFVLRYRNNDATDTVVSDSHLKQGYNVYCFGVAVSYYYAV